MSAAPARRSPSPRRPRSRRDTARKPVVNRYQRELRRHEQAEERERSAANRMEQRGDGTGANRHRRAADRHARFAASYRRALRGLGERG
jgi:hypothetical protein